jgi:hypothetical protein
MFILVLFYIYDRVIVSLWIHYPGILLGEGLQLTSIRLQIILWLRNANTLMHQKLILHQASKGMHVGELLGGNFVGDSVRWKMRDRVKSLTKPLARGPW